MRQFQKSQILCAFASLLVLLGCMACLPKAGKQKIDWQPYLSEKGSKPYDCKIAFESLPYYFPNAGIHTLNKDFRYSNMGAAMWADDTDSTVLLLLTGLDFFLDEKEWDILKAFISQGHEVVVFCSRLDEQVEQELNLMKLVSMEEQPLNNYYDGKENLNLLHLRNRKGSFGYQGRSLQGYFKLQTPAMPADTPEYYFIGPEVMGTLKQDEERPNLVRYTYGSGHLILHAAPLVLSNYFLLQENNQHYLDGLLHQLPPNINKVYWQSYQRRQREGNELSVLWRHPATRWAILLALGTLLLYVLFEMKRRQRIIPEIPKPENTSVQFATTIGQLYFHQRNHRNLGLKMWQHFQDWLRHTHNLETPPDPDAAFAQRLRGKTGQSEAQVKSLLQQAQRLQQENNYFGENELRDFYKLLQSFYKS